MNSASLAQSSVGENPGTYFIRELGITQEEYDQLIQVIFPISKDDIKTTNMSETDSFMMELSMHSIACYNSSYPTPNVEGDIDNIKTCPKHPEMNISYVCSNVECSNSFFCQKCKREHTKKCCRSMMINTPQLFDKKNFYEEYAEVDKSKIEDKIDEIDRFGDKLKENFGSFVNIMVKHWKNEIVSLSKEPLQEYAQNQLKEKLDEYKSKFFNINNKRKTK